MEELLSDTLGLWLPKLLLHPLLRQHRLVLVVISMFLRGPSLHGGGGNNSVWCIYTCRVQILSKCLLNRVIKRLEQRELKIHSASHTHEPIRALNNPSEYLKHRIRDVGMCYTGGVLIYSMSYYRRS